MDRKALFKPKDNKSKYTLSAVKREKTKTRTEQRNDLHLTRRANLLSIENEETTISTDNNTSKLTRQQAHYNKFLDWKIQKLVSKQNNTSKRPFTSAVPIGRFVDKKEDTTIARKPIHEFPQPIDFKIPIITRSQSIVKTQNEQKPMQKDPPAFNFKLPTTKRPQINLKANQQITVPQQPTPIHKDLKQSVFGPCITSTLKKEPSTSDTKKVTKNVVIKPVKRLVSTRSEKILKLPVSKKPTTSTVVSQKKNIKKINLLSVAQLSSPGIISPIYPLSSSSSDVMPPVLSPAPATAAAAAAIDSEATNEKFDNISTKDTNSPNRSINYVSPFVTTLRGKNSAKKEQKHRDSVYKLELNQSIEEPIEVRRNREAAAYFRKQLQQESERLLSIVSEWDAYKMTHSDTMESEYVDMIDVAIGQTRLLTTKKFMQFSGLIERCDSGLGMPKVFATDLEGFWSLVSIQVENCDDRFAKLNKLKANNWIDVVVMKKKKKVTKVKNGGKMVGNVNEHESFIMQMMKRATVEYKRKKNIADVSTVKSPGLSKR